MVVRCLDGNVDGLTKNRTYIVTDVFIRSRDVLFGLIDDYGVYNEFYSGRFISADTHPFEMLQKHKGVNVSILFC